MLELSLASSADIDDLVVLYCAFRDSLQRSTPTAKHFKNKLGNLLNDANIRLILARKEGHAVAYLSLRCIESVWAYGKECLLEDLFVLPAQRGQGIAGQLVAYALHEAQNCGCSSISLDTNENNHASQRVYSAAGFHCERARWDGGRQIRYDLELE